MRQMGPKVKAFKQAVLFLQKKNQKDLITVGLRRWRHRAHGPDSKQFLRRFFQKAAPYFSAASPTVR